MQITGRWHQLSVLVLRVSVGIIFLWAGLEKLIGAGEKAWTAAGFLKFGTAGTLGWPFVTGTPVEGTVYNPTHDFWVNLAGNDGAMTLVNFLVVFGECAIGIALILGAFSRFAALMGALMMFLFFLSAWDFAYGIVNQHLTYMVVCLTIAALDSGRYLGLDPMIASTGFARRNGWFRAWFLSGDPAPAVQTTA